MLDLISAFKGLDIVSWILMILWIDHDRFLRWKYTSKVNKLYDASEIKYNVTISIYLCLQTNKQNSAAQQTWNNK